MPSTDTSSMKGVASPKRMDVDVCACVRECVYMCVHMCVHMCVQICMIKEEKEKKIERHRVRGRERER